MSDVTQGPAPHVLPEPASPTDARAHAEPLAAVAVVAAESNGHPCAPSLEDLLKDRLAFERLLLDLSAAFVNIPLHQIDAQIEAGLQRLGRFLGIDRSSFAEFSADRRDMAVTHCYVAAGIAPFPQVIVDGQLPWYAEQIRRGQVIRYSNLPDDLPPEAAVEAEYCRQLGIKSNLAIPLRVGGSLFSVITFSTFGRRREWPDEVVERLRLIGEIFATSLARRRLEERTQQLREQLVRLGRVNLLGELVASIAHEINQPLCAIVTNAQAAQRMLLQEDPDLGEVRETCRDIAADSRRAHEVVTKIRGLLQHAAPQRSPLQINDAVGEVVELIQGQIVKRRTAVAMRLQDDLPLVLGDRVQLQQVLLNLIVNGIDAMAGVEASARRLSIATEARGGRVLVTVRDAGPGLDAGALDKVFEPFFTTKAHGIGMGLAISRSIVESLGGQIWAASAAGQGAAFHFSLPTADEAAV